MIRELLLSIFCTLLFIGTANAQKPDITQNNPYIGALKKVDCFGHKGLSTICMKNATDFTIVSARCGAYDVPLLTRYKTILPGGTAAVIDLSNSVRNCRDKGISATTEEGMVLQGRLNAASVDDATEVWFYPQSAQ